MAINRHSETWVTVESTVLEMMNSLSKIALKLHNTDHDRLVAVAQYAACERLLEKLKGELSVE